MRNVERWEIATCAALCLIATVGCGRGGGGLIGRAQAQPVPQQAPAEEPKREELKSRFLRALARAFTELGDDEGTDEERDQVDRLLHESDAELSRVLEQHPREAILAANKRLPEVVIDPTPLAPGQPGDAAACAAAPVGPPQADIEPAAGSPASPAGEEATASK